MSRALPTSGSIRRRLTLQLVGSAAFLASLLFFIVLVFTRDVSQRTHDSILQASATSIMDSVSVRSGDVTVDIPYSALSMLGNVSDDRVFYRVAQNDRMLTGYGDLPLPDLLPQRGQPRFDTAPYKGDSIRMVTLARRVSLNGQVSDVVISVAQTGEGQAAQLAELTRTALQLGLGFFMIAAFLAIWAAQSSIRPLAELAEAVSRRGPKDLRPVHRPVPSEMIPLVTSLNRFIERLRVSLSRSEDFIAEAAHRVRTPLATVRTQAEITLRRVERDENRASLREMIRAIDESSRAAGQLLDHAMVTFRTDSLLREEVDLGALSRDLLNRLRPIAELKDIALHSDLPQTPPLSGDPILIQNAVRNLLDNAIKYAPSESDIQVILRREGAELRLSIIDEAGGFPSGDTDALTARFARGSNAEGTIGSGLGLTIAREVAEAHGGRLTIASSQATNGPPAASPRREGSCVSLCFPVS
ncbi:sensor histidine kinase [Phaeobacter gallaeciensis]|uniref:sensor histidine kinase n=1 Tax=Phaeobacter gallaeciensis TaxID=60890 RepID=UPI000BBBCF15|nr:sensor histidine kinase [Phaeobacter gallaeciensis]ATF19156.1 signal transduction histidine kinase [Phaeobacter gallaeciensis]ATF23265.1 signal transduction histidine kinase [Phaeobacter gallaeciensis]